ncbi:MAG: phosphoribosylpyrophosphate synthetase [Ferruginibacter sp.]
MNAPTVPYLKTLVDCHKKMMEDGFKEDFVIEDEQLKCVRTEKKYKPSEITINNFFRFEGQSNPDDSSVMYVVESNDGAKGTIVDAYGAYADPDISAFITEVENIQKKISK